MTVNFPCRFGGRVETVVRRSLFLCGDYRAVRGTPYKWLDWRNSPARLLKCTHDERGYPPSTLTPTLLELLWHCHPTLYRLGNRHLDLLWRCSSLSRVEDAARG